MSYPLAAWHGQKIEIAIVGRPNVGKSSLVNRLTRSHSAVVSDIAGTTLDIQHIPFETPHGTAVIFDTAGWLDQPDQLMQQAMDRLADVLRTCDWIWFVVDGRAPLTPLDWQVRAMIIKLGIPIKLIVNKMDHADALVDPDIWQLGCDDMLLVSSKAGYNMRVLENAIADKLALIEDPIMPVHDERLRIALIGKPNAGKSTLFNAWVGKDVQIISDIAGTTRDSHTYPVVCMGEDMLLLDTAGLRRDSKREGLERIFAQHAQRAIDTSNVAVVLIRLDEGLTEQDTRLLRMVYDKAQAMIIVLTQCDRLTGTHKARAIEAITEKLSLWYPGIDILMFSVYDKNCFKRLHRAIYNASKALRVVITSARLTRILENLVTAVPPPCTSVARIKPRFAHPGKDHGTVIVRGKQVEDVPLSYKRYLEKGFMDALQLVNRPLRIVLKNDLNPYVT